jgi:hypothetical protein
MAKASRNTRSDDFVHLRLVRVRNHAGALCHAVRPQLRSPTNSIEIPQTYMAKLVGRVGLEPTTQGL